MRRTSLLLGSVLLTDSSWRFPSLYGAMELQTLLEAPGAYDGQQVTVTGKALAPGPMKAGANLLPSSI
jgi:hypothetical protein